jgi:hypothetical protein
MYLKPGTMLIGCTKGRSRIVNGIWYEVLRVDHSQVVVQDPNRPGEIALTHTEASTTLRLTHALCYASVQGATLRDKEVLLCDTHHEHFSTRMLIVGASRVTNGHRLHIATANQQRALLAGMRDIPEPVNMVEEEEDDVVADIANSFFAGHGPHRTFSVRLRIHDEPDTRRGYWEEEE